MDLSDVRVLDLTQLLPGPYATQLLADAGADVIKIERPDGGDPARRLAADPSPELAGLFEAVNCGKRSVALDLTDERAREVFYELAADADAVIEGFRPGVVGRLGVDYETLSARTEGLVYCSLTGHGQSGPDSDRPGHDLTYAAAAGFLDTTRPAPDAAPIQPAVPVGDLAGGSLAALAVVSGLLERELGDGTGTYVDLSITDALVSFCQLLATDRPAAPSETVLGGQYPCYDIYEAADGRYLAIAALEERFWERLCAATDNEELLDAHRADSESRRERIRETLAETFAGAPVETWERRLARADVPAAAVRSAAAALEDPTIRDRLVRERAAGERIGAPFGSGGGQRGDPPELGEHTGAVLEAAGVDPATVDRLADPDPPEG